MVTELPEFKSFLESSGKISPEDIDIFITLFLQQPDKMRDFTVLLKNLFADALNLKVRQDLIAYDGNTKNMLNLATEKFKDTLEQFVCEKIKTNCISKVDFTTLRPYQRKKGREIPCQISLSDWWMLRFHINARLGVLGACRKSIQYEIIV